MWLVMGWPRLSPRWPWSVRRTSTRMISNLIVRRTDTKDGFEEEVVLRIAHTDKIDPKKVREVLNAAAKRFLKN